MKLKNNNPDNVFGALHEGPGPPCTTLGCKTKKKKGVVLHILLCELLGPVNSKASKICD